MPMVMIQGYPPPPIPDPEGPWCGFYGIQCEVELDETPPWANDPEGGTWGGPKRFGITYNESGQYADYLINWQGKTLGFLFSVVVVGFCVVFLIKALGGAFR